MLRASPFHDIRSIGQFLVDSGYNTERLTRELELAEGLFATGENLQPLLFKTAGDTLLPVLARLFYVGWPVEESISRKVIPEQILKMALDCGLMTAADGQLAAPTALLPFRDRLIACDCVRLRTENRDMVVGPGAATHFLARLTAGGENETTLDLCTGPGVLAVEAAAYSRHVTGTDLNSRALDFANFTAAINGVSNAEFLCGSAFEPVAGRKFTRIIANPPFFMSPAKKFTYCDSPLDLDGFVRQIAVEAPGYLEEGGYFQMTSQWVELENESWEQRIREWTAGSGCDVLVLLAPRSSAVVYAELRDKEARQAQTTADFDFISRVNYLRERRVTAVYSGVITMRKRAGNNWFRILATSPAGDKVGPGIRERFDTITFALRHSDAEMFESRLRFADDVVLDKVTEPGAPQWKTCYIDLVKSMNLVDKLRLDEAVAECLPLFDGARTLGDVANGVAAKLTIPLEDARMRCLALARRLLQSSFVLPV